MNAPLRSGRMAMDERKQTILSKAVRSRNGSRNPESFELIAEEPLLIRIDERPYAVVMRTPGDEMNHAAGFCLGEGIIDSINDFGSIGYDEYSDPNVIDIWLKAERRELIPEVLERRSYISQTSCGICGKQMIEEIYQKVSPANDNFNIENGRIFEAIKMLSRKQKYYHKTRGSHAALLIDDHVDTVAFAEDVGRHNALDKAIGQALLNERLPGARIAVLSSRTSHELIQKAARARMPVVISHSRPTSLAVDMAKKLNMTLGFPDEKDDLIILCGEHRIKK